MYTILQACVCLTHASVCQLAFPSVYLSVCIYMHVFVFAFLCTCPTVYESTYIWLRTGQECMPVLAHVYVCAHVYAWMCKAVSVWRTRGRGRA